MSAPVATRKAISLALSAAAIVAGGRAVSQEVVRCGDGSYASYAPWRLARSTRHWGDQSRIMQMRPVYLTSEMEAKVKAGEPIPTNDWWTDALVSRWTGNLWSYPAKVRVGADGVRVAFPSYWIDNGTEMKERSALVVGAEGDFNPEAALVSGWHDFDVSMVLREEGTVATATSPSEHGTVKKEIKATLVHGSPFTWIESTGVKLKLTVENDENLPVKRTKRGDAEIVSVGDSLYGVWRGKRGSKRSDGDLAVEIGKRGTGEWMAIGLLPDEAAFDKLAPYATAIVRSTRVDWKYDEAKAELTTTWKVETEDIRGMGNSCDGDLAVGKRERGTVPIALQGFQPHHLKKTTPQFKTIDGLVWQTPRGKQRVAAGNSLSITYPFAGMLPCWAAPVATATPPSKYGSYSASTFKELVSDYASRGTFGGDTYWGGKGLLQMAFAMMAAREIGDAKSFADARAKLRAKFEDWLTWEPGEERFFFSYVPKWGGLVGEGTSYDSDAFNDHHFHYGYFTYAGALLCMVDDDFKAKFGPMLTLIAKDYANWDRGEKRFPLFRTFDPWAGHSFAGGVGDGNGNGQESTSEAMQGWGGLYLLGLALGDNAMRDAGIFGYVSEARGVAEYWFDRDRENIDYTKFKHPYNSNLTCHGVGWWTYFSGDPVWMHSIQWLPNTPALDYLSEDLKFAKWDWETMWESKEIGGWFEKGKTRDGHETPPVGNESLGNVLLSYLQRHDPRKAAEIFDKLREKKMGAAVNVDTAHMTYWATHSHLSWGELDFSVRADYPCARAFISGIVATPPSGTVATATPPSKIDNGKRSFMVYNVGDKARTVHFFDATGKIVGEVDAKPRQLTIRLANGNYAAMKYDGEVAVATNSPVPHLPLIPKGVTMLDIAQGKGVKVTSQESDGLKGANITDGDDNSRWSSAHDDAEAMATIDLGELTELYGSEIKWENSFAAKYLIEISSDGAKWTPLGGERAGFAGLQKLDFAGEKARYIRMHGLAKATQYGYSMFSWRIFGKSKSHGAGAPLGLAVESAKPVLKEGVACPLAAKAWYGGDKFKSVDVEWRSDDGTFSEAGFTPSTNGFAAVTASALGLSVTKRLPVEEALAVSTLSFATTNMVAIVGEPVKLELSATDQFSGKMALKGVKMEIAAPGGKKAVAGKDFKAQKGGWIVPLKAGEFRVKAKLGGSEAECVIAASSLKDVNLARLATVTASGEENGGLKPEFAADGDMKTRWGSRHRDGEWICFDFGRERTVSSCAIAWENARAEDYVIETSLDGAKWTEAVRVTGNEGGRREHSFKPVKATRLRILGLKRNTSYGISIFETDIR